jgi:curved DNA-binding protein CbpA
VVAEDDDRTHYEVLGVDRRASKDKVRDAYRERLNDAQAEQIRIMESKSSSGDDIAQARNEVARVRDAWQVLSDPTQRQRYDARLGNGSAGDSAGELELADEVVDDDEVIDDDPRAARRAARTARDANRPPGMFSPEHPPTPPSWPATATAPPPRARTIALLIDCFVLLVFFIGAQIAGVQFAESQYPAKTDRIERLDKMIDRVDDCDDGGRRERQSERCTDARADAVTFLRRYDPNGDLSENPSFETLSERLADEQSDLQGEILPTQYGVTSAVFLLVALLYLIPSSVVSGQTLGKRLLAVRLVQVDGSKATLRTALLHYGVPLVVALLLSFVLGQLAFAIVLFGVLTWARNPNRQGLQDRVAGTLVVDG